jgi:hypothetical protein
VYGWYMFLLFLLLKWSMKLTYAFYAFKYIGILNDNQLDALCSELLTTDRCEIAIHVCGAAIVSDLRCVQ